MARSWGKAAQSVGSSVVYFLCCPTVPVMMRWALSHRGVNFGRGKQQKKPKTLSCTRSTPFICTSHAYRKRNKVYTQCCCCIFFLFIHIRRKIYKLSGGFSLCCLCVCFFWRRMGRFTAVNVVYARVFFFFFYFHPSQHPDWHFGNQAAKSWLMVSAGAAVSLFGEGVVGLFGPITARCREDASGFGSKRFDNRGTRCYSSSLGCIQMVIQTQRGCAPPFFCCGTRAAGLLSPCAHISTHSVTHWPPCQTTDSEVHSLHGEIVPRGSRVRTQLFLGAPPCFRFALLPYVLLSWYSVTMVTNNRYRL